MLILGPNLITPTSLEVGPLHGLNLKAFHVIVMCSYSGKPLPKARKYQFYMNTNASLSANLLGPYLWILGHIHKLKSNPLGWWLEYFTVSEWWWYNSLDWSMIHWLLETTAIGWWSCFFFLVNQENIWGLRCNIVSWGENLYCLLDPQTFISHLLWASIYKDTDSDCSHEIKTLFLG